MGKSLFAIIGFVAAIGVFFFYTKPVYATVAGLQTQIAQYQEALDKAAQLQTLKQKLLARYNAFDPTEVSRLQTMLPDHVDNIGLILELDNLASHYGLALENVDVAAAQSGDSQSAASVVGTSAQKYNSLTIHFSTYGSYDTFQAFLKDLETSLRTVDLVSLTLSPQGTPGTAALAYGYDMTLRTYWLK